MDVNSLKEMQLIKQHGQVMLHCAVAELKLTFYDA